MKKKVLLLSVLLVFGTALCAGCSKDELKIESRSDDSVTERDSAITYDIDETGKTENVTESVITEKEDQTDAEPEGEREPDEFVFSTDENNSETDEWK